MIYSRSIIGHTSVSAWEGQQRDSPTWWSSEYIVRVTVARGDVAREDGYRNKGVP